MMDNLKLIFEEDSFEVIKPYLIANSSKCYYPSSGYDFRHIFFLDHFCLKKQIKFPKIFIHSDYCTLSDEPFDKRYMDRNFKLHYEYLVSNNLPLPHPMLYNGYILEVFGGGNSLIVNNWSELKLSDEIVNLGIPQNKLFHFWSSENKNSNKVYAIKCQLVNLEKDVYNLCPNTKLKSAVNNRDYTVVNSKVNRYKDKILVADEDGIEYYSDYNSFIYPSAKELMILLFTVENYNLFYNVLVKYKIKLDFLIHVCCGGRSFGGSSHKMDFVYLHLKLLGIKYMIIDNTLDNKLPDIEEWATNKLLNPCYYKIHTRERFVLSNWQQYKIFYPRHGYLYIKGNEYTGNSFWNYSNFDNDENLCISQNTIYLYKFTPLNLSSESNHKIFQKRKNVEDAKVDENIQGTLFDLE